MRTAGGRPLPPAFAGTLPLYEVEGKSGGSPLHLEEGEG